MAENVLVSNEHGPEQSQIGGPEQSQTGGYEQWEYPQLQKNTDTQFIKYRALSTDP